MESNFKPSAACCNTPAIIGEPYEWNGKFMDFGGTRAYISGSPQATKALFIIYDVFGYSNQILEGADILAKQYLIFMPDLFDGSPAPLTWMPLDGPTDAEALDGFCNGPGETSKTIERIVALREHFQQMYPQIEAWGLVGFCWGGWVSSYALRTGTPYKACAQLHPGFPEKEVAQQVTVPVLALCSVDEPESDFSDFKAALKVENRFEQFPEMVHGWMSARGDLRKDSVRQDFLKGYQMVMDWFVRFL